MIFLFLIALVVTVLVVRRRMGVVRQRFNDHHHFEPAARTRLGSARRDTL